MSDEYGIVWPYLVLPEEVEAARGALQTNYEQNAEWLLDNRGVILGPPEFRTAPVPEKPAFVFVGWWAKAVDDE